MNKSEIILYKTQDCDITIDVLVDNETVWLTQEQMGLLFEKNRRTIGEHIKNVFNEGELEEKVVCRNFRHDTPHGAVLQTVSCIKKRNKNSNYTFFTDIL